MQTPVRQHLYVVSARSAQRVPTQSRSKLFSSVGHNSFYSQRRKPPPPPSHPLLQAIIRALKSSSVQGKQDQYSLRLLLFTLQRPLQLMLQCLVYFCSRYSVCPLLLTLQYPCLLLFTLQCLPTAVHCCSRCNALSTAVHVTVSAHCCSRYSVCLPLFTLQYLLLFRLQSPQLFTLQYLPTAAHAAMSCLLQFTLQCLPTAVHGYQTTHAYN